MLRQRSVALALVLVVAAACTSDADPDGSSATSPGSSDSTATPPSTGDATASDTTPSTTAAPTSAPSTTSPAATAPATSTPASTAPPTTAAPVEPSFALTITDAGAEPRELRRLSYTPGSTTMTMTQTQEVVQTIDGFTGPPSGPISIVITMDVDVEVIDGGYRLTSTVSDATAGDDVDPGLAGVLAEQLGLMVGLRQTIEIDEFGRSVGSGSIELPTGIPDEAAALVEGLQLEQAAAPLPDEPIGEGATWTVEQTIPQLGLALRQTTTYELVEIDGDRLHVTATGTQTADPGPAAFPGAPSTVTVELIEWSGVLTYDARLDLTRPVPDATITVDAVQAFAFDDRGDSGELEQELSNTVVIAPG